MYMTVTPILYSRLCWKSSCTHK